MDLKYSRYELCVSIFSWSKCLGSDRHTHTHTHTSHALLDPIGSGEAFGGWGVEVNWLRIEKVTICVNPGEGMGFGVAWALFKPGGGGDRTLGTLG